MGVLTRVVKAAWAEMNKPKTYVKGDEFEDYVRQRLFPKERYDLLHRTHDYRANESDFVETSKEPDFRFRSRRSGREFLVEAKYRSRLYDGAVEWCKPYQLERYKKINRATLVFIAIGLGGLPSSPGHVYLVPVREIPYRSLFPSFLREYEVRAGQWVNVDRILDQATG
ncbi:MAG: hypothetical protein A2Z77_00900 [Chloroflexi bacterium RBG_13_51_36]|nr:MAG: hypothetical protein A2Z77_00900 [Chloroflexi bacterium RBG_13_51_36]